MGVATGCGCKEVYRLLIPTPLVSYSSIPTFCSFKKIYIIVQGRRKLEQKGPVIYRDCKVAYTK